MESSTSQQHFGGVDDLRCCADQKRCDGLLAVGVSYHVVRCRRHSFLEKQPEQFCFFITGVCGFVSYLSPIVTMKIENVTVFPQNAAVSLRCSARL